MPPKHQRLAPGYRPRFPLLTVLLLLIAAPVQAQLFALPAPGNDIIGQVRYVRAKQSDTLLDIARRFDLGYEQIRNANPGVDTWLPGAGTRVILPTRYILPDAPREGIVVNVAEMRLYYYPKARPGEIPRVETYPISIGRQNWTTPLTTTRITGKITNPAWYPPASIRAEHAADGEPLPMRVAPGPDNPLGQFALRLGLPGYLIHGTNKDYGIGMQVSHGCIRLYPEDIVQLFYEVSVGTPVRIVNQPYKTGWENGALYLEVHPLLDGTTLAKRHNLTPVVESIIQATDHRPHYPIDWRKAQMVGSQHRGIPVQIGPTRKPGIQDASR